MCISVLTDLTPPRITPSTVPSGANPTRGESIMLGSLSHRRIPQTHMETKHTPGPIEIRRTHPTEKGIAFIHPVNGGTHSDSCTQEMAAFYLADEGSRNEANAVHMVQCWNLHPQLLEALEPFNDWDFSYTAWHGLPEDTAILFDHKSGRQITVADFKRVTEAIALATGSEVANG